MRIWDGELVVLAESGLNVIAATVSGPPSIEVESEQRIAVNTGQWAPGQFVKWTGASACKLSSPIVNRSALGQVNLRSLQCCKHTRSEKNNTKTKRTILFCRRWSFVYKWKQKLWCQMSPHTSRCAHRNQFQISLYTLLIDLILNRCRQLSIHLAFILISFIATIFFFHLVVHFAWKTIQIKRPDKWYRWQSTQFTLISEQIGSAFKCAAVSDKKNKCKPERDNRKEMKESQRKMKKKKKLYRLR